MLYVCVGVCVKMADDSGLYTEKIAPMGMMHKNEFIPTFENYYVYTSTANIHYGVHAFLL